MPTRKDVAGTQQGTEHANEQQQQVYRNAAAAHTQIGTEMNANSACGQNQNLLMMELGTPKVN